MLEAINPIDPNANKAEKYELLIKQAEAIVSSESDLIANMANLTALLKDTFNWFWIGFYRVDTESNQLVLGPFQGPLACTRINHGKGVCGEVWATGKAQIVDDVNAHPNHIACSSLSQSEIVVPVRDEAGKIIAVLDIDSDELAMFDEVDGKYLQQFVELLK